MIYLQKSRAIIGVGNANTLQTLIRIVIDIQRCNRTPYGAKAVKRMDQSCDKFEKK